MMREPGRGREVICSLRNVKTARTSCRGLPGHAQLLPWVRVTFFKTRNDIYRTRGLESLWVTSPMWGLWRKGLDRSDL